MDNLSEAKQWVAEAIQKIGIDFEITDIKFSNKMSSAMGLASWRNGVISPRYGIKLSGVLWPLATTEQRRTTVIHEACHIIARYIHGAQAWNHGHQWQRLMVICGASPNRCHDVNKDKPYGRKNIEMRCTCSTYYVTAYMARYTLTCRKCKGRCIMHKVETYLNQPKPGINTTSQNGAVGVCNEGEVGYQVPVQGS